uniref:Uncharacterized protein n=1 Tax=Glossina brevipalpis TaxID=37001 RepID=A0A1A9WQV3_9MUSC
MKFALNELSSHAPKCAIHFKLSPIHHHEGKNCDVNATFICSLACILSESACSQVVVMYVCAMWISLFLNAGNFTCPISFYVIFSSKLATYRGGFAYVTEVMSEIICTEKRHEFILKLKTNNLVPKQFDFLKVS